MCYILYNKTTKKGQSSSASKNVCPIKNENFPENKTIPKEIEACKQKTKCYLKAHSITALLIYEIVAKHLSNFQNLSS